MWRCSWKWLLLMQLLRGITAQSTMGSSNANRPALQSQQQQRVVKPQIYWASSGDQKSGNSWSQLVSTQFDDRDWKAPPAPYAAPYSPPTTQAPPAPAYVQPTPPPYVPPAPPAPYVPPPPPTQPYVPPPQPAPSPPYTPPQPDPSPPYVPPQPDPSPPYVPPQPAPPPSYYGSYGSAPAPAPGPATGYYYYYYPTKAQSSRPSFKDLIDKEKEYLSTLLPGSDKLNDAQKVWIAVLAPLIVVALVVPLAAILFSGFTVTSTGRKLKLGPISLGDFGNDISDLTSRVLQSEECVQRLVCELGSYAADVPYKSLILPVIESIVPDTMKGNLAIFEKAALSDGNDGDIRASQCIHYKCSIWNF